jgi:hypothetical protein
MDRATIVLGLMLLLAAPGLSAQAEPPDSAVIHETSRRFSEAYVKGDAARKYWTLAPGRRITHHAATPTRIVVDGDHACDHGIYEVSGERDGKAWGPVQGKYVIVWRREKGGWRMQLDIWNSGPEPRS